MNLNSIASAFPPHAYTQADCLEAIQRSPAAKTLRSRSLKLLERILEADSGIDKRHFYLAEPSEIFSRDAQTLNRLFEIQAPALAGEALDAALDRAGLKASHLDALFVCTCTGYLCPRNHQPRLGAGRIEVGCLFAGLGGIGLWRGDPADAICRWVPSCQSGCSRGDDRRGDLFGCLLH